MEEAGFTYGKSAMIFPTPLLTYTIADAERINAALLEEIDARRRQEEGIVRSNRAGWHSKSDFFDRPEPAHAEASKAINGAIIDATNRIRDRKATDPIGMQLSGWINVNPPSAYNVPHDHPGSYWSGCYYIKTDASRPKDDQGGAITFLDARSAPAGQSLVRSPIFRGSFSVQPEPGTLLLFPSNVKHWVHPNTSAEDRVTMAFNVFMFGMGAPGRIQAIAQPGVA